MYKCIIGLGNPGAYSATRHNVGKHFLDSLGTTWKNIKEGEISVLEGITLYKPNSFMNICGPQIKVAMNRFGVTSEEIIVLHDDVEIILGKAKIRKEGSAKGHNGVRSMIQTLGNSKFHRLLIGIGRPNGGEISDYVLSPFTRAEQEILYEKVYPECSKLLGLPM